MIIFNLIVLILLRKVQKNGQYDVIFFYMKYIAQCKSFEI